MKRKCLLLITIIFALCLCGCGGKKATAPTNTPVTAPTDKPTDTPAVLPTEEPAPVPAYPVTITDQAGRKVVVEKAPEKLVSGYYISTSLLIALDLDDKLVGIEAKAKSRNIYKLSAERLISLPSVGTAKEFDLEGCAALSPDLVILPIKLKNAAASLEELGIQTILVNPESDELLMEMVDIISAVTDTKDKADELKSFIAEKKEMLQNTLKDVEKMNVYLAGNSDLLMTAGSKMYQDGMLTLAGGKNVAGADITDTYWAQVDYEQVLAWDPDCIVIAADAGYGVQDVLDNPALSMCTAVKNGKVYKLPSDVEAWDSPVPSGILGSVWVASALYPDLVTESTRDSIIEEFYEKFYGFKYSKK